MKINSVTFAPTMPSPEQRSKPPWQDLLSDDEASQSEGELLKKVRYLIEHRVSLGPDAENKTTEELLDRFEQLYQDNPERWLARTAEIAQSAEWRAGEDARRVPWDRLFGKEPTSVFEARQKAAWHAWAEALRFISSFRENPSKKRGR